MTTDNTELIQLLQHLRQQAYAANRVHESQAFKDAADALQALQAENARLKTVPMKYRRMEFNAQLQQENDALQAERDALQAKLAALEKQEVTAYQRRRRITRTWGEWHDCLLCDFNLVQGLESWETRKLYLAAGAAQPPKPVSATMNSESDMPEAVRANDDHVICPHCCNQFRAIPANVQRLMLSAGFEPPFTNMLAADAQQVAVPQITEQFVDEFLADYMLDDGDNYGHTPDENERFMIKDAIMGLLAAAPPAPEHLLQSIATFGELQNELPQARELSDEELEALWRSTMLVIPFARAVLAARSET